MPHNSRIRAAGSWLLGQPVSQAEFEAFDAAQYKSVNGDAGGDWTPAAATAFGGAGWAIRGQATLSNLVALTTELGGVLTFGAGSTFTSAATLTANAGRAISWLGATTWASGSSLTFAGGSSFTTGANNAWTWNGTVTGTCTVAGSSVWTLESGASATQNAGATLAIAQGTYLGDVGSTTTLNGTVNIAATDFQQKAGITLSGSAAQTAWRTGTGTDADGNYGASVDLWIVPTITATRTYTVLHTSGTIPVEGTRLRFHGYNAGGQALILHREDGSTLATTSNQAFYVELEFRDSAWHCSQYGGALVGSAPSGG